MNIVQDLRCLSAHSRIFFQWISSRTDIYGNEVADGLVKEGTLGGSSSAAVFFFSELASRVKLEITSSWRRVPIHEWYDCRRPGAALNEVNNRKEQTGLAGIGSGHFMLYCMRRASGFKVYPFCLNLDRIPWRALDERKARSTPAPGRLFLMKIHEFIDLI